MSGATMRRERGVRIGMALLLAVALGACRRDGVVKAEEAPPDPVAEATAVHFRWLQYFLDADAAGFVSVISPDAVDIGGGEKGDGALTEGYLTVAFWEEFFTTKKEYVREMKGRPIEELLLRDSTVAVVVRKGENDSLIIDRPFRSSRFLKVEEGDVLIHTYHPPGSPLVDGWSGVYRKIDGEWKVVGFD
jgi:hypothetical protein